MTGGSTLVVKVRSSFTPLSAAEVRIGGEPPVLADDNGIARIAGRAPGSYQISARAPGFSLERRWVRIEIGGADTVAELELTRGAALSGSVVDEQGKRVANAEIAITWLDGDRVVPAISDESGAWEIDAVAAGRYHPSATAVGFGPTVAAPLELDGKTPREGVVVRVTPGGTLFGKVRDTAGHPVAGVRIAVQQEARVDSWDATTDAQGRYEIRGMPEGSYLVMRYLGRTGYPEDHHALVVAGQRTEQDLVVDDDHVDGIVVDAKGKPLPGIWVVGDDTEVITDAGGRFALVLREGSHRLTARRAQDSPGTWPRLDVEGSAHDLRIVLGEAGSITGRVLLDGAPVSDYAIAIVPPNDRDLSPPAGRSLHTTNGRFTLDDLPVGSWRVAVAAPGSDVVLTDVKEIASNKAVDVGDIALTRGRRITGHVRDAAGAPIAGARVTLNNGMSPWNTAMEQRFQGNAETVTDASGAFAFDGISRRLQYALSASAHHPQYRSGEQRNFDGDTIDFVLAASGGIDGIVDGFVGDQTFFVAYADGASSSSVEVNRIGEFRFDNLAPGMYTVRESMNSSHRRIKPTTVKVEAGHRTKMRAPLDMATVEVRVRITSPDCRGQISLAQLDDTTSGAAGTIACKGTSTLPYVAPGKYTACDWDRHCATITIGSAPVQTIEIFLVAKDER